MSSAPIQSEITLSHRNPYLQKSFNPKNHTQNSSSSNLKRRVRGRPEGGEAERNPPIIVHCHLCWDWVWQRPQQFISRLSRGHKVLFIETMGPDPELAAPLARFRKLPEFPNITVLRLQ